VAEVEDPFADAARPNPFDSTVRHRRSARSVFRAFIRPANYTGLLQVLSRCDRPLEFLARYLAGAGDYPTTLSLRHGPRITVYSPDDVQTVNEIFFRGDYHVPGRNRVIVDFGANIGVSALYFLRDPEAFVYAYEPLPLNVQRFRRNVPDRYELIEAAVGVQAGPVSFGYEPTGRYGGIGRETGVTVEVPCLDANRELAAISDRHGQIDVLKIDIETMEAAIVGRMPSDLARRIRNLVVEYPFRENPLAATHEMRVSRLISRFRRRA
jgi:FkbM family methyltransferase